MFRVRTNILCERNSAPREAIKPDTGNKIGGAESENKNYVSVF